MYYKGLWLKLVGNVNFLTLFLKGGNGTQPTKMIKNNNKQLVISSITIIDKKKNIDVEKGATRIIWNHSLHWLSDEGDKKINVNWYSNYKIIEYQNAIYSRKNFIKKCIIYDKIIIIWFYGGLDEVVSSMTSIEE